MKGRYFFLVIFFSYLAIVNSSDISTWYIGDNWQVHSEFEAVGPNTPEGETIHIENNLNYRVVKVINYTQVKTGATFDCYKIKFTGTANYSGSVIIEPYGRIPFRIKMASVQGYQYIRRSDLANVATSTSTTGTMEININGWIEVGDFQSKDNLENFPPQEIYDFPINVGESWRQNFTVYMWGESRYPNSDPITYDESNEVVINYACTKYEKRNNFNSYKISINYEGTEDEIFMWYAPAVKYVVNSEMRNVQFGDMEIVNGTSTLIGYNLVQQPVLDFNIEPNPALLNSEVNITGYTRNNVLVSIVIPDAGNGYGPWNGNSDPNFAILITAPIENDDTPTNGQNIDKGSHGVIVSVNEDTNNDGVNDYRVHTLVLSNSDEPVVDLILNDDVYEEGEQFILTFNCYNPNQTMTLDTYIVLDIYGHYYFYPTWTEEIDFQRRTYPSGKLSSFTVLSFQWPSGVGSGGPFTFYGALTYQGTYELVGNYDSVTFSYR